MVTDFKALYEEQALHADAMWEEPLKEEYEADRWYCLNRNQIFIEMIGDVCEGKSVLSVGAGREWIEREFLNSLNASKIVKTDLIPSPEHDIIEADAHNLPFENETFDCVSCRDVIEHVQDEQVVMKELNRVLKVGGYLIISTPNVYNAPFDNRIHVRGYTPHSFLKEMVDHGFKVANKRGNVPNILLMYGLRELYYKGIHQPLEEFKDIANRISKFKDSYYIGTQLFILAKKVLNEY